MGMMRGDAMATTGAQQGEGKAKMALDYSKNEGLCSAPCDR